MEDYFNGPENFEGNIIICNIIFSISWLTINIENTTFRNANDSNVEPIIITLDD